MRSKKKRSPKLTRLEKMTKGLMLSSEEVKSKFTVREVEGKGRAIFLYSRIIRKDSFVLEYDGDVITHDEAVYREKIYEMNNEGCYILFFRFRGRRLAIDATRKFDSYARYLNHSKEPNIRFHPPLMLDLTGKGVPRIAAYALRDIYDGEEIVFDYGVRDGQISWLQNRKRCHTSELSDSNDDDPSSSSDDNDEERADDRDVVMSITRTPMKSFSNDTTLSRNSKNTSFLAPLKNGAQQGSSSMPPRLSIPSGGHGIRLIPLPSRTLRGKTYIGSIEGLGQPLKIMRSVEVRTLENRKSKSIISLSASDDSSKLSPSPSSSISHADFNFPENSELNSTDKVLEWQQTTKLPEKHDSFSGIKILDVTSLRETVQPSPSFSSCSSGSSVKKSMENSLPCITNIISGNLVPKSLVPAIHSTSQGDYKEQFFTKQPSNSTFSKQSPNKSPNVYRSPPKTPTAHHHTHTITSVCTQRGNVSIMEQSPSKASQSFVKTSKLQVETTDTICLSDSDEDVIVLPSDNACEISSKKFLSSSSFKQKPSPNKQTFPHSRVSRIPVNYQGLSNAQNLHMGHSTPIQRLKTFLSSTQGKPTPLSSLKVNDSDESVVSKTPVEAATRISNIPSYALGHINSSVNSIPPSKPVKTENSTVVDDDEEIEIHDDLSDDIEILSDEDEIPSSSNYLTEKSVRPPPAESEHASLPHHNPLPSDHRVIPVNNSTSHFESSRSRPQPHVAIVKPYSAETETEYHKEEEVESAIDNDGLSEEEKMTMNQIFQPFIHSKDNLSLDFVEKTIGENVDFFNGLIGRGVSVNTIRRLAWSLFKFKEVGKD